MFVQFFVQHFQQFVDAAWTLTDPSGIYGVTLIQSSPFLFFILTKPTETHPDGLAVFHIRLDVHCRGLLQLHLMNRFH